MTTVNLIALLEDALADIAHGDARIEVERRYHADEAWVTADPQRMQQVFTNLSRHSVSAMPEGGSVAVTVAPAGDCWRLSFANTGMGLSPQQVEKVFEPFQAEFGGGTGLGLAIVYQILQAHSARISVQSSPGKGIEFVIELKQAQPPPLRPELVEAVGKAGVTHG